MKKPEEKQPPRTFAYLLCGVLPDDVEPGAFGEYASASISTTLHFQPNVKVAGAVVYSDTDPAALFARLGATPIVTGL